MADEPTTGEATEQPTAETTAPPEHATEDQNGGKDAITFASQKDLQDYINETLKKRLEREERKREEAEAKARKEAEEKALEQQQEFKQLADKRAERILDLEAQVGTLEQITSERDELQTALQGYLDKERDGLPEHILSLLNDLSPVKQLAWISANRASLGKQNGRGIEPTPKGQSDPRIPDEERRRVAWKPRL